VTLVGLAWAGAAGPARADDQTVCGFAFGGTGETVFEHTRAALRDPHFGLRIYGADPVPGTLSPVSNPSSADADTRAAAAGGTHRFLDVAFGERAPLFGWYDVHPTRSLRHARGFQVNLDAAVFALVDLDAQSSAVINTDFRIGGSLDLRPWREGWDRISLSVGAFHQSSHLGDEYVLSAHTIQDSGPPEPNPVLPYRANPSYLALPATVSIDIGPPDAPWITGRLYFGGTVYPTSAIPEATRPDARVGAELRYGQPEPTVARTSAPAPALTSAYLDSMKELGFGHTPISGEREVPVSNHGRALKRGARSYLLAYELLAQPRYRQDPATPGRPVFLTDDGYWLTHHLMAMLMFNLDTQRSTSNAVAFALEYLDGRNQHGQLVEYATVRTAALSILYYW
jgi:hypothetical protein